MREPGSDDAGHALAVEAVEPRPPGAMDGDEARFFQDAQVPRRGRPAMAEALREIPRRELAPEHGELNQDLPPDGMRQSFEDEVFARLFRTLPDRVRWSDGITVSTEDKYEQEDEARRD
jgi:hypothetical protein